jgi:hypothetical protein
LVSSQQDNRPEATALKLKLSDRKRLVLSALAVASIIIVGVIALIFLVPAKYHSNIDFKWFRFGVATAVLILYSVHAYWRARRSLRFWCIFLSFLAVYVFGVGYLWTIYGGLSTAEIALIAFLWWICMALVIYWMLGIGPDLRRHRGKSPWVPEL